MSTRISDHLKIENSAVADHLINTDQAIQFNQAKVLARIDNYQARVTRGAIEIANKPENLDK